jgi:hypothetical protein
MAQVCAIEWSIHDKEFVSSHGFTHNQLILWRYMGNGRVQKITELTGHQARSLLVKIVECIPNWNVFRVCVCVCVRARARCAI